MRIRFLAAVVGTICGPHSPTFGWTRVGADPFRFRFVKMRTWSLYPPGVAARGR